MTAEWASEAAERADTLVTACPHCRIHFLSPDGQERVFERSNHELPPEPKEIKPHPYGVELGRLVTMLKDTPAGTISQFLTESFSRVTPGNWQRLPPCRSRCDYQLHPMAVDRGKHHLALPDLL